MQYFQQFNIININDKTFRDLFFKVYIDNIESNQIVNYELIDYETIKDVANSFYKDTRLWWVIAIINNIYDLNFDWVLTNEQINVIATEKATDEHGNLSTSEYLHYYDLLIAESNSRRNIKLIKPEFITNFINLFVEEKNNSKEDSEVVNVLDTYNDTLLDEINYKAIKGTIYDITLPLCNHSKLNVYDVKVLNVLNSIILSWKLPPNNDDYQGIWIIDNGETVALLDSTKSAYTIQNAELGDHEIHIILIQKKYGVETNCNVFVPLPTISVDVDKEYFETKNLTLFPQVTGGYGTITLTTIGEVSHCQFYPLVPEFMGVLYEKENKRITFIATDSAGRSVRKRIEIVVNRFPELQYDVQDEYDEFDEIILEPIITYGYGHKTWTCSTLPTGLTMNSNGVISGQITVYGTFNIHVTMKDEVERVCYYNINLKVNEVPPPNVNLSLESDYERTSAITITPSS